MNISLWFGTTVELRFFFTYLPVGQMFVGSFILNGRGGIDERWEERGGEGEAERDTRR